MRNSANDAAIYQLQRSAAVRRSAYELGRKARRIAVAIAPKGKSRKYINGIKVVVGHGPNPSVFLVGGDYKSHWIEWGSNPRGGYRPGQHILERAMLAAGGAGLKYRRVPRGSR